MPAQVLELPPVYGAVIAALDNHSFAEAAIALGAAFADVLVGVHTHPEQAPGAVAATRELFTSTLKAVLDIYGDGIGGEA